PKADSPVLPSGNDCRTVRRKLHGRDQPMMSFKHAQFLPGCRLVDTDHAVPGTGHPQLVAAVGAVCGRHKLAVRSKCERRESIRVTHRWWRTCEPAQLNQILAALETEKLDHFAVAYSQSGTVGRECRGHDFAARKCTQYLARRDVPQTIQKTRTSSSQHGA